MRSCLALIALLTFSQIAHGAESVKICNKQNPNQFIIFTADNDTAVYTMNDGNPPQTYAISNSVVSNRGEAELTKAIGEKNTSYKQFVLRTSAGEEEVLVIASGKSTAKYLVVFGPMGKLISLGSTANCNL